MGFIRKRQLKLFVKGDKRPVIIITYKVRVKKGERNTLIKDDIGFWIDGSNKNGRRYKDTLPIVFVENKYLDDLDLLNCANLIYVESRKKATTETELKWICDRAMTLYTKYDWRQKRVEYLREPKRDEDYHLKFPDYNYTPIQKNTFTNTVRRLGIMELQETVNIIKPINEKEKLSDYEQ